jgi:hypothetical protein
MDFQSLLPIIIPAIASAASYFLGTFLPRLLNNKYYQIIAKVYPILDPILADNIKPYGESGVRKIIQEVVVSVSDGQLSSDEITKTIDLFLKEFNLAKAATVPANVNSNQVLEAVKAADSISRIDLSGIKFTLK